MRAEGGDDDGVLSLAPVVSVKPDGPKNGLRTSSRPPDPRIDLQMMRPGLAPVGRWTQGDWMVYRPTSATLHRPELGQSHRSI
jgi:hypothetical protein